MSELVTHSEFTYAQMGALLDWVRGQPDGVQQQILTQATNEGLNSQQLAGLIQAYQENAPLSRDAMMATPLGQEAATNLALAEQAQESGRSTFDERDIENLKARVENRVKELQASHATPEEILATAAQMAGGSPELAAIAQDTAQAQIDTQKFNVFAAPAAEQAAPEQVVNPLAAALAGTNVAQQFGAALNNYASNGQRNQPSGRENERGGWDIG